MVEFRFFLLSISTCIESQPDLYCTMVTAVSSTWQVQAAVHVRSPGYCWSVCSAAPGWDYQATQPNLPRDIYPTLVSKIKVVIYNGEP